MTYGIYCPVNEHSRLMISNVELGRRLRVERQKADLSQKETAAKLNISRSAYQRVESGERDVRLSELTHFAKVFPGIRSEIRF